MLPLLTYSLFLMAFFVHEYQDFKPVRLNIPSLGYITCSYERTTVLSLSVSYRLMAVFHESTCCEKFVMHK